MKGLSERQLQMLGFVHSYRRRCGYAPSLQEMQAEKGRAAVWHLIALERKGMIRRVVGVSASDGA